MNREEESYPIAITMFLSFPVFFLALGILGIGPNPSIASFLGWTAVGILFSVGITWIQFKTEVQKLVQPTRGDFSICGFFQELPYLQLKWNGKRLLDGSVLHEMFTTITEMVQSGRFTLELVNTNPDPKYITAPTGMYKRFNRAGVIGWGPEEESKPIHEKSQ